MSDRGEGRLADNRRRLAPEESKRRGVYLFNGEPAESSDIIMHAACDQLVSKDGQRSGREEGGGGWWMRGERRGKRKRDSPEGRGDKKEEERDMARARVDRVGV